MKKTMFLLVFSVFPAALAAQTPALSQLGGAAAVKADDIARLAVPAAPAPAQDKGTMILLDPRTGKTFTAISAGGGFIVASTGQYVPAVYNGSGYILPSGQYLPMVGGSRSERANPGLGGKWIGWGDWTYQGSGTHCDTMSLEFEDGTDYLFRKSGYFDCGVVALNVDPARYVKKGTQLLGENGAVAGSYENNVITLYEAYSETIDITTVIRVNGLHFDYSEIWNKKDGSELYNIQGRLFTGG
ncbi:MAG: hypothetical protein WCK76_00355 [Elusimicrobiota bacterium]